MCAVPGYQYMIPQQYIAIFQGVENSRSEPYEFMKNKQEEKRIVGIIGGSDPKPAHDFAIETPVANMTRNSDCSIQPSHTSASISSPRRVLDVRVFLGSEIAAQPRVYIRHISCFLPFALR